MEIVVLRDTYSNARFNYTTFNHSIDVTTLYKDNLPNIRIRILFELEEPIPSEGRSIITSDQASIVGNLTDSQIAVEIPIEKLYNIDVSYVNNFVSEIILSSKRTGSGTVTTYGYYYGLNINPGTSVTNNGFVEFIGVLWNGISVPNSNVIELGS